MTSDSNKPVSTMTARDRAGWLPPSVMLPADDGDEAHFCSTCGFAGVCLDHGYGKPQLAELQCAVEHVDGYAAGDYVFRTGAPSRSIFAVRSGVVKTCMVDHKGKEQVLGFYLPGDVFGLNAVYRGRFPCDAVAIEDTGLCRFSFPAVGTLAAHLPAVQKQLFRLFSKKLACARLLNRCGTADARLAAFLIDLGERYARRGFSGTRFRLSMRWTDIANHLGLAAETVSRVLRRFRSRELLRIGGREVTLLAPDVLRQLAHPILGLGR